MKTDKAAQRKPVILFVEDENFIRAEFSKILRQHDYEVKEADNPDTALEIASKGGRIDLLLTDVQMALRPDTQLSNVDTKGGEWAGLALGRWFRRRFSTTPIIFWTTNYTGKVREAAVQIGNARLVSKRQGHMILDEIGEMLEGIRSGVRPRIFIVHGHDTGSLDQLCKLIKDDFRLPPPIVLREQASRGKTLIEKIEDEAPNIDLVIVLLTPDDRVIAAHGTEAHCQARQNVIFELGYFMGLIGRAHGRLILLHKDNVQIPSDIQGILTIDISKGLESAAQEIKRELREWL